MKHKLFFNVVAFASIVFVLLFCSLITAKQAGAALNNIGPTDSCGKIAISFTENPVCPTG